MALPIIVPATLSSFYLDIIKDRFYVEQSNGTLRRSAQTSCWYILDTLTQLMAPIFRSMQSKFQIFIKKIKNNQFICNHLPISPHLIELLAKSNYLQRHLSRPQGSETERPKCAWLSIL